MDGRKTAIKRSLQWRLTVLLGSAMLFTGLLAALASFLLSYDEAKEFQDDMLRQIAYMDTKSKGAFRQPDIREQHQSEISLSDPESQISINYFQGAPPGWLDGNVSPGFHTFKKNGQPTRVFLLKDAAGNTTVVIQPTETSDEIAINSALRTLLPLLLLLPVMAWLIMHIIRNGLKPVGYLAKYVDEQSADQPHQLSDREIPQEIKPFIHAINRLLERISALLGQQRRFIADAAHELRTPLTALSIQVENLQNAGSAERMMERLQPLKAGIERARKLTEQLLNLARIQAIPIDSASVDVSAMTRELIAEFFPIAESEGIDLGMEESGPLVISCSCETLRLIIKNGLENALKYTNRGGEVTLRIYSENNNGIVEIIDDGPGIPAADRERVFDPFFRQPGEESYGSGLGLAIAREAAITLGGILELLDRPGVSGLVFRYSQKCGTGCQ